MPAQPTDTAEDTTLSAAEVCSLADVTYRSLDYWVRCAYVDFDLDHDAKTTPGSGYPRRFTETEARRVTVLAQLVRAGLHVGRAAAIVRELESTGLQSVALGGGVHLVIDTKELEKDADRRAVRNAVVDLAFAGSPGWSRLARQMLAEEDAHRG